MCRFFRGLRRRAAVPDEDGVAHVGWLVGYAEICQGFCEAITCIVGRLVRVEDWRVGLAWENETSL